MRKRGGIICAPGGIFARKRNPRAYLPISLPPASVSFRRLLLCRHRPLPLHVGSSMWGRGLTYSGTGGVFARNAISWRIEPFFMRFRPHPSDSVARILVEFASAWDRTCGGWVLFIDDRADLRAKPRPLGLINHFAILSASVRIRRLLPRRIRLRAESYMWRMGIYRGTSGVSARKRHF